MIKDLVKLSNKLDLMNLNDLSNQIDSFICLGQQSSNHNELKSYFPNLKTLIVPILYAKKIDLLQNKLGILIFDYIANAFAIADDKRFGQVSVNDINNIIDKAFKFDYRFREHKDTVTKPISPEDMRNIIETAIALMKLEYNNIGDYNIQHVYEVCEFLIEAYIDSYHHDYLKIEQRDKDFINQDKGYIGEPILPELSEMERESLLQQHDRRMSYEKQQADLNEKFKKENPEAARLELERKIKQEKRKVKPEWHKAIFGE